MDLSICKIVSPSQGWIGPLSEAPDPVFAEEMMGGGLLFDPTIGEICAPCSGRVVTVAETKHAVTIRACNGAELLIHVGIDTVKLKGKGFHTHIKVGDQVEVGAKLISFDLSQVGGLAKSLLTPIVIVNSDAYEIVLKVSGQTVKLGDPLMTVKAVSLQKETGPSDNSSSANAEVRIPLAHGLHARPAARLINISKQFNSKIWIATNDKQVPGNSTVSLMGLGTKHGDTLTVSAKGSDSEKAVAAIVKAVSEGLGEDVVPFIDHPPSQKLFDKSDVHIEPVKLDGSEKLKGTTGAPGLVFGEIIQLEQKVYDVSETGEGADQERRELLKAIEAVRKNINDEITKADGAQKDILTAHLALLEDPVLFEGACKLVEGGKSAGYAWRSASREQAANLSSLNDPLMAARADDLMDLEIQILSVLSGEGEARAQHFKKSSVVVAEELLPSQFSRLISAGVGGICLVAGGPTSHVSILAADNGIAALVATGQRIRSIPNGTKAILAADKGYIHVAPTKQQSSIVKKSIKARQRNQKKAREECEQLCVTHDNVRVEVFGNLGASAEASHAVKSGAEGCGLLRSEFLFLGRPNPPSEDEQMTEYQKIADSLGGRPMVVRTLDIGGDKPVPFVKFKNEDNPALGLRGIRMSFARPDLLKTQFRALLRTESKGKLHIMLPMIVSLDEMRKARALLEEASSELGVKTTASLGIMIETPASAILADRLAQEADFFSIGTNDLTQYVLAMDRGNPDMAPDVDALHPAVLRLIEMTVSAGSKHDKWVGVCGAMASDLIGVPILIGLGVRELSSTLGRLPDVKAVIRTFKIADCEQVAREALKCSAPNEVRELVRAKWPELEEWA